MSPCIPLKLRVYISLLYTHLSRRSTGATIADNSNVEEKQLFLDEINVMKKVSDSNNPHILKMLGCVTTTNPMMLILQFMPHGNLKNYLRAMKDADDVRGVIIIL